MNEREALKLALEAFGEIEWSNNSQWQSDRAKVAITAIKEALANDATNDTSQERVDKTSKGVHEPVAWVSSEELLVMRGNALGGAKDWRINVGLVKQDGDVGLYTTPPQRTWVGLTELEKAEITSLKWWDWEDTFDIDGFIKAIEAKLKEKNS